MTVHVFGVRHLSPAGAWHLRRYLDAIDPEVVLIEGMSDAHDVLGDLVRQGTVPPVAILAYTDTTPVRTLTYPLARYSPEYQAMRWAFDRGRRVELIDLPSDVFLALDAVSPANEEVGEGDRVGLQSDDDLGGPTSPQSDTDDDAGDEELEDTSMRLELAPPPKPSLYQRVAERAGEPDYDAFWERRFEHDRGDDTYRRKAYALGESLRELEEDAPRWRAENLVREAYMRRRIHEVLASGVAPERCVAVVGAFHASVLGADLPPMSDAELARLPRRSSKLTLMPYSYFRLSSQSGYGAGNHAPAYFELVYDALEEDALDDLPARYLTLVARHLRDAGTHRSVAEVIEGVRLARTLSALQEGHAATLRDLHDAAVTLIGQGQPSVVREAIARVDVGTAIGRLPKGVSRTSIQDDFERLVDELELEKFRSTVKQDLVLDLRENRRAKTPERAFLDLRRSSFLHRLRVLGVGFATPTAADQRGATWKETWQLQWTPESEIELVEAVLLGETVELATAFRMKSTLDAATSVAQAAAVVSDACRCAMPSTMELARRRVQELSTETSDLRAIADAASRLAGVVRYGDVRRVDAAPLLPLIAELFVQGSLAIFGAAVCDDPTSRALVTSLTELDQISQELHAHVDEALFVDALRQLAAADDRSPRLSGYACAILLERGRMAADELAREVSRRLSPGAPADLGAGWFEGLATKNRYALIARQTLWEQLADYVGALNEEEFRRAVVFLRRAFGSFAPAEKRQIAENLGRHWGVSADAVSEVLDAELTADEAAELADFDFDV